MSFQQNVGDNNEVVIELGEDNGLGREEEKDGNQFETEGMLKTKMTVPEKEGKGWFYLSIVCGFNGGIWMLAFWIFFIIIGFTYWWDVKKQ